MMKSLSIAVIQDNPILGNMPKNGDIICEARQKYHDADIIMTSEMFLCGYPPEDLVQRKSFLRAVEKQCDRLVAITKEGGPALLIGLPYLEKGKLYNSFLLAEKGKVAGLTHKYCLPNEDVFDEVRNFAKPPLPSPMEFRGVKLGVPICADIWNSELCQHLKEKGAELLLIGNASPYRKGRGEERMEQASARAVETKLPLLYLNQLGGQDELVFDGDSFLLQADGTLHSRFAAWQKETALIKWQAEKGWVHKPYLAPQPKCEEERLYQALMLGLRDYVEKNHFPKVVLGLSGGVDSAFVACLAVDALGAERVHPVFLPFRYTSEQSRKDADASIRALGLRADSFSIEEPYQSIEKLLAKTFAGKPADVTEENLQSRLRGVVLMALSNKFGSLLLTTGNKSELSVGYATLYGDMNGGFNPIKDIYKTELYRLAKWRNKNGAIGALGGGGVRVPENILTKAPSAELAPNQKDEDSLPAYEVLDAILYEMIERETPLSELEKQGYGAPLLRKVEHLLYRAEYKRRQASPGIRVNLRNFGRGRRYPITHDFREAQQ